MNNGLQIPSSNFNQSRSGLRTLALYKTIDLSVARQLTSNGGFGSAEVITLAGNSFYCDADPSSGNFKVRFQDTNADMAPADLYCAPGAIFNLPFTQILITNPAQPGKFAKIVYGVDIDFQPGSVSQVSFAGNVNLNGSVYNGSYVSFGALAVGSNVVIPPASNTAGIILANFTCSTVATAGGNFSLLAKTSAPASTTDGDGLGNGLFILSGGGTNIQNFQLINPVFIPTGKGLYIYIIAGSVLIGSNVSANWQQ
jgi:hypothetical protein